jgi:hypothetical protein
LFCKRGAEFTIEFFDYGVDVAAEAPPADEVMTHEEFDRLQLEFATEEEK